jgi:hypothetical protein
MEVPDFHSQLSHSGRESHGDSLHGWGTQVFDRMQAPPKSQNRDLGHPGS